MPSMTQTNLDKFQNLYVALKEKNDEVNQNKILDLIDKVANQDMRIGFAGHFSAGKSTVINTLLADDLLPSSPIPTSANIVRLKTGSPYTVANFQKGLPVKYEGETDIETIKSLCKDGEVVTGLEISRPQGNLPPHVSVIDTPGVDSTNDADRLITESSLHLMDYIFYVMDYNHVQSEVNLMFLSEMQKRRIPFSIIINQVDKHVEDELSFDQYKESVEMALEQWRIVPSTIYFTSMRDFSHEKNEYFRLKDDFEDLFKRAPETIAAQAEMEAEVIIDESVRQFEEEFQSQQEALIDRKESISQQLAESPIDEYKLRRNQQLDQEAEEAFEAQVYSFISNAYLMPSGLREYAERYLESLRPNFKIGVIFSRKKTEEERKAREDAFYEALQGSIEQNLKWPLRDRMLKTMDQYSVADTELLAKVHAVDFNYPKERLHKLVESGAEVTGPYILRYTDQVAKDIQQAMRQFIRSWQADFLTEIKQQQQKLQADHHLHLQMLEEKEGIEEELVKIEKELRTYKKELQDRFYSEGAPSASEQAMEDLRQRNEQVVTKSIEDVPNIQSEEKKREESVVKERMNAAHSVQTTLDKVRATLTSIRSIEGLEGLYHQLVQKQQRLENRHYTIALFGAFSAGKSSFANALLGDQVLPVSPNPTTATINKISPPTEKQPDKTIEAQIKSEHQLLEDLEPILSNLQIGCDSLHEVFEEAGQLPENDWNHLDQKQHTFLRAFIKGYESMRSSLGKSVAVPWKDFASYVAEEHKSCFIEEMELYYDCTWTQAGITLVDTPGADSVNARHTDVSFEYIKDSDAVLFVTYYNHPFSHADQKFLKQLGRVKDSFAMDKMFFIVNAADLASSEDELHQVENYIKDELSEFQIRQPRLFSVSSLHALQEKRSNIELNSGITSFEDTFHEFLEEELAQMLIQSIETDLSQVKEMIAHFIHTSRLDEKERQHQKEELMEEKESALNLFENRYDAGAIDTIQNKAEKQMYYVHERMMLNFTDFFKRHFNPATINGKEQDVKDQFKGALEQLLVEINFEMVQETKAVCVRLERTIEEVLDQSRRRLEEDLRTIRPALKLNQEEKPSLPLPTIEGAVTIDKKQKDLALKGFRNTKSFFEKNEKEMVKDHLSASASPVLSQELQQLSGILSSHYINQWEQTYQYSAAEWEKQVGVVFNNLLHNMEHPIDPSSLEKIYQQLF
ncbi:dynamin family protein [Halobacillus litoralis]|uniref:dynamin family protein n=1 Tax=Halobacillus litoralis TaxID=45668 RepID=UPI002492251F|nr:dynamin family protein [Halobacillus litoralis]